MPAIRRLSNVTGSTGHHPSCPPPRRQRDRPRPLRRNDVGHVRFMRGKAGADRHGRRVHPRHRAPGRQRNPLQQPGYSAAHAARNSSCPLNRSFASSSSCLLRGFSSSGTRQSGSPAHTAPPGSDTAPPAPRSPPPPHPASPATAPAAAPSAAPPSRHAASPPSPPAHTPESPGLPLQHQVHPRRQNQPVIPHLLPIQQHLPRRRIPPPSPAPPRAAPRPPPAWPSQTSAPPSPATPTSTGLLDGHATYPVSLSISTTWCPAAANRRATVAPPNPPPTTTTRAAPCARPGRPANGTASPAARTVLRLISHRPDTAPAPSPPPA